MDKIVEQGIIRLQTLISETKKNQESVSQELISQYSCLLDCMISVVSPLIHEIGSEFLRKAKVDGKGDLYDQEYYEHKM
ncbi:MAG TPA: hypothetical protein O0X99_01655, partial [Methanocorpusculum sp.]|nr:hypothetical protein [Methanocorpusculum sp.]